MLGWMCTTIQEDERCGKKIVKPLTSIDSVSTHKAGTLHSSPQHGKQYNTVAM